MKPHKGESQDDFISRCMSEVYGADAPDDRTQEQAVAICMGYWREEHGGEPLKRLRNAKGERQYAPSPETGEEREEYLDRCLEEMTEDDPSLPEEDILSECRYTWDEFEEERAMKARTKLKLSAKLQQKIQEGDLMDLLPSPEEGESREEYMDRCTNVDLSQLEEDADSFGPITDDDVEEVCAALWNDWSEESLKQRPPAGVTQFRTHSEKAHEGKINGLEFVLSDETPDRMGEVLTATGWDYENFKRNPIALFNHRSDFPIGRWHNLRVEDNQLRGHLELAPEGTSERIDEIRKLVEAGILRAVSVGFRSLKKEQMDERADVFFGPFRYLKQELVETSLVSVPANPNALAIAKSLKISPATIDFVFAGQGNRDGVRRRGFTGGHADRRNARGKANTMTLAQRILDLQTAITAKREALTAHLEKMDDSNVSDADLEKTTQLNAEIAQLEKTRTSLVEAEKHLGQATAGDNKNGKNGKSHVPALVRPNGKPLNGKGDGEGDGQLYTTVGKKELTLLDLIVRAGTVSYVSKMWDKDPHEARVKIYGDDEPTKLMTDLVLRAASAPAMTTVTGWAAELVQQTYTAMMETLMPKGILTRLAAKGLSLTFGRAGKINIPTRSRTPSIAGSFVGEGMPIPVRQGAFTSQALTPKKMAVITTWTREMDEHSIPAIEGVLRDAIQTDTTVAVDSVLIDANPATVVRPAGLLNGVAAIGATTGGGLNALVGDLKALIGALTTATFGNIRSPVWLMNPGDMLSIALTSAATTGIFPFKQEIEGGSLLGISVIDSGTIPAKTVIIVDAADFVVAGGEAPRFEISDQATLHMEDTNPAELAGGSPAVTASPQRSLFQTDSLALRMVMPLNWVQRRAGTVAWVQNVTWS
jgi:HK97 family phage prohead protease/HK97 family phage major capsid protein